MSGKSVENQAERRSFRAIELSKDTLYLLNGCYSITSNHDRCRGKPGKDKGVRKDPHRRGIYDHDAKLQTQLLKESVK